MSVEGAAAAWREDMVEKHETRGTVGAEEFLEKLERARSEEEATGLEREKRRVERVRGARRVRRLRAAQEADIFSEDIDN